MDKVSVKLINPIADPWTHADYPLLDEQGAPVMDELGNPRYQEFHTGDVIQASGDTAEHLIVSRQGVILNNANQPMLDNQGLPADQQG